MYTICNNSNHQECVYNMIKQSQYGASKPPLHVSRYACMVRKDSECHKRGCSKTMGPPVVPLCPPEHYLKKHSRAAISIRPPAVPKVKLCPVPVQTGEEVKDVNVEVTVNNDGQVLGSEGAGDFQGGNNACGGCSAPGDVDIVCTAPPCPCGAGDAPCSSPCVVAKRRVPRLCCNVEKPAVPPTACSRFGIIARGCRDFIRENAIKAIRQPAKIPAARYVDQAKGTSHDWCESGFARKYVGRHDYGMIPGYLVQRRMELQDKFAQEKYASEQLQRDAKEKCRHLDEDERKSLLCGLKTNWEQVYQEFQALPLQVDTPVKIKQKEALEDKLKEIEKDIQLLERHNHIFVADASKTFYMA